MNEMHRGERSNGSRALTEAELDAVTGGDAKAPAPAAKLAPGKLFEVEDYSFDIEQVL